MKTIVTVHAIEQYQKRWSPKASFSEAESDLKGLLYMAKSIGKTPLGHTIVVSSINPEIRMVLKEKNVCVTVLPKSAQSIKQEIIAEEIEAFQEEINEFILLNKCNISSIEERLIILDSEIIKIDNERADLVKQKSLLCNEKDILQNKLKKLKL
jgi:hypothetical protein